MNFKLTVEQQKLILNQELKSYNMNLSKKEIKEVIASYESDISNIENRIIEIERNKVMTTALYKELAEKQVLLSETKTKLQLFKENYG